MQHLWPVAVVASLWFPLRVAGPLCYICHSGVKLYTP